MNDCVHPGVEPFPGGGSSGTSGESRPLLSEPHGQTRKSAEGSESPQDTPVDDQTAWRVLASCVGLFADAYDIFTIDLVLLILGSLYGSDVTSPEKKSLMVGTLLAGIIAGQLAFGLVADLIGRKWAFVATAGLTVVGAAFSAATVDRSGSFGLPAQLALCRFFLGLGIGGEYPLSASVTAEAARSMEQRGRLLTFVISMQGWAMLLSGIVALIALELSCSLEALWRLLLALGALPSLVAFGLRWQLHESVEFNRARAETTDGRQARSAIFADLWPVLVCTSLSWFVMNISLYSLGTFKGQVLHKQLRNSNGESHSPREEIIATARFSAITSIFAILGFAVAGALINRLGRLHIQLGGFAVLAVIFFVQGGLSGPNIGAPSWVVVTLLGLVFFFQNFGPNTTTYIIPAEVFPTTVRATCHGISAASGKVGALLGTASFPLFEESHGMRAVYFSCGFTAIVGVIVTASLMSTNFKNVRATYQSI